MASLQFEWSTVSRSGSALGFFHNRWLCWHCTVLERQALGINNLGLYFSIRFKPATAWLEEPTLPLRWAMPSPATNSEPTYLIFSGLVWCNRCSNICTKSVNSDLDAAVVILIEIQAEGTSINKYLTTGNDKEIPSRSSRTNEFKMSTRWNCFDCQRFPFWSFCSVLYHANRLFQFNCWQGWCHKNLMFRVRIQLQSIDY